MAQEVISAPGARTTMGRVSSGPAFLAPTAVTGASMAATEIAVTSIAMLAMRTLGPTMFVQGGPAPMMPTIAASAWFPMGLETVRFIANAVVAAAVPRDRTQ